MEFNVETKKLVDLVGKMMESNGFHQTYPTYERWGKDGVFHITYEEFYLEMCGNDNRNFDGGVSVILKKGSILSDVDGETSFNDGNSLMGCIRHHQLK